MVDSKSFAERHSSFFRGSQEKIWSVFSVGVVYQLPASRFVTIGKKLMGKLRSLGGKGKEMRAKVNQTGSTLRRGPEEERDYHTADSPGWRRRAGKASQVTAASSPVTKLTVTKDPTAIKGAPG